MLDNGLPDLPDTLAVNHGIAVARWVDGDLGIVLVVNRNELGPGISVEDEYAYDVQPHVRVNGRWESTNGSGGSNWFSPPFERPPLLTEFAVSGGHVHQQQDDGRPMIRVVDGIAGASVVSIDVRTDGRVVSMPIESPIGAWVVGVTGSGQADWIARDVDGRIAASGVIDLEPFGIPDWVKNRMNEVGQLESKVDDDGFATGGLWVVEESQTPPDLASWFERRTNGGRDPNESYIESERVPDWRRLANLSRTQHASVRHGTR